MVMSDNPKSTSFEVFIESHRGVTLLLGIAGPHVSAVTIVYVHAPSAFHTLPSVYLNADWNEDIGFHGFSALKLNRETIICEFFFPMIYLPRPVTCLGRHNASRTIKIGKHQMKRFYMRTSWRRVITRLARESH
jgi:hypothetical protein